MAITVKCQCGKQFGAPDKYAGKRVKCPECGQPLTIPQAAASVSAGAARAAARASAPADSANPKSADPKSGAVKSSEQKLRAECSCGKVFAAPGSYAGKTVKCPACKQPVKIPVAANAVKKAAKATDAATSAARSKKANSSAGDDFDSLYDEVGLGTRPGGGERRCSECKASMSEEAVLCIQCGYHENLGRKMETARPVTQEERLRKMQGLETPKDGADAGSTAGKSKSSSRSLVSVAITVGAVILVGGALFFVFKGSLGF